MRKFTFVTTLTLSILLTATVTAAVTSGFPDVPSDHWAAGAIERLKGKGVIQGYTDGDFKPNNMVSRAEVAVMIDKNNQALMNQLSQPSEVQESQGASTQTPTPQVRDDSASSEDNLGEPVMLTYDPNCIVEGALCAIWGEVNINSSHFITVAKIIPKLNDPLRVDIKFYQGDSESNIPSFTTDSMLDVGSKYFGVKFWDNENKLYLSANSKAGEATKYYVFDSSQSQKGWIEFFGTGL